MNIIEIIEKKKIGKKLSYDEIEYTVNGFTKGSIADYQMSALLMAICIKGMDEEETLALAKIMKNSGDIVDLSGISGIKVDKHSTGGVGDKTTLIVAPIAAALGVKVAKMSGRGLGFTGGTIDKMEAIPNMKTSLEEKDFFDLVNSAGLSVIGQTGEIAPADKKIYALRDVTGTVGNLSLISSSIMSKKLAAGSDKILLDVKCGSGGFMKTQEEARELAKTMAKIGSGDGKETVCVITDMNQPLGKAIGNSLEVIEAIETLKGKGPEDITLLSVTLAGIMAFLGGKASTMEEGKEKAIEAILDGSALNKLRSMIEGQGGEGKVIDDYSLLPKSDFIDDIIGTKEGYVKSIVTDEIGNCSQMLGAGRVTKEDVLDLGAGIILNIRIGDYINIGDKIGEIHTNKKEIIVEVKEKILKCIEFSKEKPKEEKLIKEIII